MVGALGRLLPYLAATWLVEWLIALAVVRRSPLRLAWGTLLVNALTNPPAVVAAGEGLAPFWAIEALVVLAEIPADRALLVPTWRRAVALALASNSVTAALSFLV